MDTVIAALQFVSNVAAIFTSNDDDEFPTEKLAGRLTTNLLGELKSSVAEDIYRLFVDGSGPDFLCSMARNV
jgi:hypothetical protein